MPYEQYRTFTTDHNGDGVVDGGGVLIDSDGDDLIDGAVYLADFSGDGLVDTVAVASDWNGDGSIDSVSVGSDLDGDGHIDAVTTMADTDGDGVMDTAMTSVDVDGDGSIDAVTVAHDANGDGVADTYGAAYDVNGDGQMDTFAVGHDYNQDGVIDSYSVGVDTNADGHIDYAAHDYNADGYYDAAGPVDGGGGGGEGGGLGELLEDACFTAGTLVGTPDGEVPIEELRVGQRVWSWEPDEGRLVRRTITRRLCHGPRRVVRLRLEGVAEPLVVTPGHRLLAGGRWRKIGTLTVGERLVTARGDVRILEVEDVSDRVPVFNLHTAGEHCYLVSGVVAHNFTHWPRLRAALHRLLWDPVDEAAELGARLLDAMAE